MDTWEISTFWDWFHWKVGIPARASSYLGHNNSPQSSMVPMTSSLFCGYILTFCWWHTHTHTNIGQTWGTKTKKTVGHLMLSYDPLSGQSDFRLKYSQFPPIFVPFNLNLSTYIKHLGNCWLSSEYHQDLSALPRNNVPSVFHKQMHLAPTTCHSGNGENIGYPFTIVFQYHKGITNTYGILLCTSNQFFQLAKLVSYPFSTCRSRRMRSGCCPGATWPECSNETFGRSLTC